MAEKIVVIQSVMAEDYQVVLVVLLEEIKLQEEILVKDVMLRMVVAVAAEVTVVAAVTVSDTSTIPNDINKPLLHISWKKRLIS